ncbi:MAG: cysteine--tRNA ligase [Planctomycetes bacterium]|nr:cysteine--tRNA ligase [Planctomycetota bacterium]
MPEPFRIYNTLDRRIEDFVPEESGRVGLYVCGMTVYDHAHIGHGRFLVVFDAFVRYLRHRGWQVTYVRNYTDIDDKIIVRAIEKGEDPIAYAQYFIDCFREDAAALGLMAPDHEPRVTGSMASIQEMIGRLVASGHAYESEGSVWFEVARADGYGKLSGQKVDETRSADDAAGKRAPADFALWKAAKEGEPAWPSPWGPGRPGWHIECSAMSRDCLGETFDIHGGGLDLVFPHHENEIAQSECANGRPYARYWMHNGLLTMASGQKMGKSLGNVINIRDLLQSYPAEVLRLYYLQNHYRSPLPWSPEALPSVLGMLARLYEARETARSMTGSEPADRVAAELGEDALRVLELARGFAGRFLAALDDDFNTPQALGIAFELARAVNRFANHKKAKKRGGSIAAEALAAFDLVAATLGLLDALPEDFQEEVKAKRLASLGLERPEVEDAMRRREEARAARDFAQADAIRLEMEARGVLIMDTPEGPRWRLRLAD